MAREHEVAIGVGRRSSDKDAVAAVKQHHVSKGDGSLCLVDHAACKRLGSRRHHDQQCHHQCEKEFSHLSIGFIELSSCRAGITPYRFPYRRSPRGEKLQRSTIIFLFSHFRVLKIVLCNGKFNSVTEG